MVGVQRCIAVSGRRLKRGYVLGGENTILTTAVYSGRYTAAPPAGLEANTTVDKSPWGCGSHANTNALGNRGVGGGGGKEEGGSES